MTTQKQRAKNAESLINYIIEEMQNNLEESIPLDDVICMEQIYTTAQQNEKTKIDSIFIHLTGYSFENLLKFFQGLNQHG